MHSDCENTTHTFDSSQNMKSYFTLGISTWVDVDFTTVWLAVTKRAPMKQRKLLSATLRRFHFT